MLRDYLAEHVTRTSRSGADLIFGHMAETPFTANMLQRRADKAWAEAGLERITPHEGRHTFASLMIAAGVNAKALATFMGHANISITLDRYGHLMPGSEDEAAGLLDAYVETQRKRAEEHARTAATHILWGHAAVASTRDLSNAKGGRMAAGDAIEEGFAAGVDRASQWSMEVPPDVAMQAVGPLRDALGELPELHPRFVGLFSEITAVAAVSRAIYNEEPLDYSAVRVFLHEALGSAGGRSDANNPR